MRDDFFSNDKGHSQSKANHVPDVVLERYLLDELNPSEKARLTQRLKLDEVLRERLNALQRSNDEFLKSHDPLALAHGARERVRRETFEAEIRNSTGALDGESGKRFGRFFGFPNGKPAYGSLALLAPIVLVALVSIPTWRAMNGAPTIVESAPTEVIQRTDGPVNEAATAVEQTPDAPVANPSATPKPAPNNMPSTTPPPKAIASLDVSTENGADPHDQPEDVRPDTRLKGIGPGIALYRRTAAGAEPLQPGAKVKPGDVIRIGYRSGGHAFGAIFSVDGNGNVTRHWPSSGERAARLEGGETLLPQAFELDAAPDYERFYLLTGTRAFDLPPVLEILHTGKSISDRGLTVVRFDLLKENGI